MALASLASILLSGSLQVSLNGLFISRSLDVSSHVSGASSLKKLRALGSNCLVTWLWVKYITTNVLDIGCVFAGGLASGIYPTNSAEACK